MFAADMVQAVRVTSYNLLADAYASRRLYPTVAPDVLSWQHRGPALLARLSGSTSDILCLQEVDAVHWAAFEQGLAAAGWSGVFAQKRHGRVDGCALLCRKGQAEITDSESLYFDDGGGADPPSGHVALAGEFRTSIGPLRVVSTHLRWQFTSADSASHIGYRQATELLDFCAKRQAAAIANVICGDFNVTAEHPLVRLFLDRGYQDAYAAAPQNTCAPNGQATRIDYIFVSRALTAIGQPLPDLNTRVALPTRDEPSDHLPITAVLGRSSFRSVS